VFRLDSSGSGRGLVAGTCERCNEPSESLTERFYQLHNCQLFKDNFIPRSTWKLGKL
jgi:hypothetical protein